MEINGWIAPGEKDTVKAPNVSAAEETALRAAIRSARDEGGTGDAVLWERPRAAAGLRIAARIVLGMGCVVGTGLLLALAVVGSDTRSIVLGLLCGVVVIGGGFVGVVWALDVGITVHADGTLRRSGWGGVREMDLRSYRRVTVKRGDESGVDVGLEFGAGGD